MQSEMAPIYELSASEYLRFLTAIRNILPSKKKRHTYFSKVLPGDTPAPVRIADHLFSLSSPSSQDRNAFVSQDRAAQLSLISDSPTQSHEVFSISSARFVPWPCPSR